MRNRNNIIASGSVSAFTSLSDTKDTRFDSGALMRETGLAGNRHTNQISTEACLVHTIIYDSIYHRTQASERSGFSKTGPKLQRRQKYKAIKSGHTVRCLD